MTIQVSFQLIREPIAKTVTSVMNIASTDITIAGPIACLTAKAPCTTHNENPPEKSGDKYPEGYANYRIHRGFKNADILDTGFQPVDDIPDYSR